MRRLASNAGVGFGSVAAARPARVAATRLASIAAVTVAVSLAAAGAARAGDRLDRVVAGLGRSPLFLDPDAGHLLPPADRPAVEAALRDVGVPMFVVVIPIITEDESGGVTSRFLDLLHARAQRPGEYVVADDQNIIDERGYDLPRRVRLPTAVFEGFFQHDKPLAPRLAALIDVVRQAPSAPPSSPGYHDPPDPIRRRNRSNIPPLGSMVGEAAIGVFLAGPFVGLSLYGVFLALVASRRRLTTGRASPVPASGDLPLRTPDAPAEPGHHWLRQHAADELAALNAALGVDGGSADGGSAHAGSAHAGSAGGGGAGGGGAGHGGRRGGGGRDDALSAYDAAGLLLGGDTGDDPLALVGAIVLARDGRVALHPAPDLLPVPCGVNPLHGPAAGHRTVVLLGAPPRPWPLCPHCGDVDNARRDAAVLRVTVGGTTCPYYEVPGFWQETGFDTPGPELAGRVREHLGVS